MPKAGIRIRTTRMPSYAYPNAEHDLLIPAMLRKLLGVQSILVPALTGRASTDSLLTAPAPPFVNQSQSTRRCGGSVRATSMCGFRAYLLHLTSLVLESTS